MADEDGTGLRHTGSPSMLYLEWAGFTARHECFSSLIAGPDENMIQYFDDARRKDDESLTRWWMRKGLR